jgi:hypothetical protein
MNSDEKDYIDLFWIFFQLLEMYYMKQIFNDKTSNANSFDQILNSRHFNSVIYKEENVYGDRENYMKDNAKVNY